MRLFGAQRSIVPVCRQTTLLPELAPDIVLTQPQASGVDETLHTLLVIAEGGSITLHLVAAVLRRKRHLMTLNRGDKFIFWVHRMSAYERCELATP